MTDTREILSALIDGEPVDADVVATILEKPESRTLIADFLRLRTSVQAEDHEEPRWRDDRFAMLGTAATTSVGTWLRVAAVLALLAAGAAGGTWVKGILGRERPPEPTRIVQLQLVNNR